MNFAMVGLGRMGVNMARRLRRADIPVAAHNRKPEVSEALDGIEPFVADSGEGRWAVLEAVEQGMPAPVISLALTMRFASQGKDDYAAKLLAMMRQGSGGHAVKSE